jgi:serine/threonine protein kinase
LSGKEDQKWSCGVCAHRVDEHYLFCTNCGSPRPDRGWFCEKCGKKVEYSKYLFCVHCGAPKAFTKTDEEKEKESAEETPTEESKSDQINLSFTPSGYKLIEKIGFGGFSDVYKASKGRQIVALKIPRFSTDRTMPPEVFRKYVKEAEVWSKLKHPHIVEVYNYGSKPLPWISMEFMEGGSLLEQLGRGPLGLKRSLDIAIRIANAIEYAHHYGVIHQDITPRNILFTNNEVPKLTDWGLVKILIETPTSSGGKFEGTVACASPEQLDPERYGRVDWRTDIYCFGVVLFWMLSGTPPFCETDLYKQVKKVTGEKARSLHDNDASIPPEIDQILERALNKHKEDRYDAMIELRKELEKAHGRLK